MKEQERVPGPGASSWIITDNERIAVLERQLAEAQGKLDAILEEALLAHRIPASTILRILEGE